MKTERTTSDLKAASSQNKSTRSGLMKPEDWGLSMEEKANIIQRIFFWYMNPIITRAQTQSLKYDDLNKIAYDDTAHRNGVHFDKRWEVELARKPKNPSIVYVFYLQCKERFWISFIMEFLMRSALIGGPLILKELLNYIYITSKPFNDGIVWVCVLFAVNVVTGITENREYANLYHIGVMLNAAVNGGVFRKALRLSIGSRTKAGMGQIMNMVGQDTQRIFYMLPFINILWAAPASFIVLFVLIGRLIGVYPTLPTAGVLLICLVVIIKVNNYIKALEGRKMVCADKRVKMLNETLQGIKVVKLYAWEQSLSDTIGSIRAEELRIVWRLAFCRAILFVTFMVAPMLMALVAFYVYVAYEGQQALNPPVVFGTLSLIAIVRLPLVTLPVVLTTFAAARVSLNRISNFFQMEEGKPLADDPKLKTGAMEIHGSFGYQADVSETNLALQGVVDAKVVDAIKKFGETNKSLASFEKDLKAQQAAAAKAAKAAKAAEKDKEKDNKKQKNGYSAVPSSTNGKGSMNGHSAPAGAAAEEKKSGPPGAPGAPGGGEQKIAFKLKDIHVSIQPGELVEIIGPVGCGKSSFLLSAIGEMDALRRGGGTNGEEPSYASLNGNVAYVPQQAFLRNMSFKENILFGKPYDKDKYEHVLELCALTYDREILPNRDDTEIGEKGINLSGGQKQRISLARAVYSDADIMLLDDPLSAVDQHVGGHIFFKCILSYLRKEKNKTVLLVTHQVQFLEPADRILVMKDGTFTHQGTFEELKYTCLSTFSQIAESRQKEQAEKRAKQEAEEKAKKEKEEAEKKKQEAAKLAAGGKAEEKDDGKLIKAEKTDEGEVPLSIYKFYVLTLGSATFCFALLMGYIISQGSLVLSDWWLAAWTGQFFGQRSLGFWMGVYCAIAVFGASASFGRIVLYAFGIRRSANTIHSRLLKMIMGATMRFFDTTPLGRIVDVFSKDQQFVDTYLPMMCDMYFTFSFNVLGYLIFIGTITPYFFIPLAPLGVIYYLYQRHFLRASRQFQRLWFTSLAPVYSHLGESVQGVVSIRAYRCQQAYIDEVNVRIDRANNAFLHSQTLSRWLDIRLDMIAAVVIFFAALFVLNQRTSIDSSLGGLSLTYAVSLTGMLGMMVLYASFIETFMTSIQRIHGFLQNTPQEAYEGKDPTLPNWPEQPLVEFKNVDFKYVHNGPLILKNVSFRVPARCKVGIVGRTGAGKSSVTVALFRLCELFGGQIFIDGVDITRVNLTDLRNKLAIIPQDPVLFGGTVRYNLDPFNTSTDDEIWTALRRVSLKEAIEKLDGQLKGTVSPGGSNFSVGQRQLFCLARALLRRAKILILDEATASVDYDTDAGIQRMLRQEFVDCTVFTIAHRINTITDSDYILVLDNGEVVEFAPPKQLLQNPSGHYTQLLAAQSKEDSSPASTDSHTGSTDSATGEEDDILIRRHSSSHFDADIFPNIYEPSITEISEGEEPDSTETSRLERQHLERAHLISMSQIKEDEMLV